MKQKVLFLCSNNSARSQIAEGLLRTFNTDKYEVYSAGIKKTNVNSYAIEVMREIGIDISKQYSKTITEFKDIQFDYVITLCDNAQKTCPFFPGKKVLHKSFEDPTIVNGDIEEILEVFRKVRDEIKKWIITTFNVKNE